MQAQDELITMRLIRHLEEALMISLEKSLQNEQTTTWKRSRNA